MARYNNFARNARIIELRRQGLWPTQIADEMAMSRNAVLGVLNRAGLCNPDTDRRPAMMLKKQRGADAPGAKLTSEAVADIRANYVPHSPSFGGCAFARKYRVNNNTVWKILNGRSYVAVS